MGIRDFFKKILVCGYWDIVVCNSIEQLNSGNVIFVKSTLTEWYADPFLFTSNGIITIFCERKKISKKNGDICTFFLNNNKRKKDVFIKEPFHLSFPNFFKINNDYFVMPESSRGHSLRLYRYNQANNKATLFKVLKKDCNLVDSVIYSDKNKLFIYSYDVNGELIKYELLNDFSLKQIDSFIDKGHTFRPAGNPHLDTFYFQDCSETYGNKIIARKKENNEFCYVQDNYILSIDAFCRMHGYTRYHTINFDLNSQSFVFDAYKERINFLKPFLMLWRIIYGNL